MICYNGPMRPWQCSWLALSLAVASLSVGVTAQVRALTAPNANLSPYPAAISPDGVWVLYTDLGGARLAAFDGSSNVPWPSPSWAFWSAASDAAYAFDQTSGNVQRIAVPALTTTTVANVQGLHNLLGCDATGATLFGVRQSAPGVFTGFRLAVASGVVTDLASNPALRGAEAVDPAGTVMLARLSPQIFVEQMVAVSLSSGTVTVLAQHIAITQCRFADGYRGAICQFFDPFLSSGQRDIVFAPLDASAPAAVISSANAPMGVDVAAQFVLLDGYSPTAGYAPVVVGTRGGGEVCLDASRSLVLTSASMSANGRVAFTAAELTTTLLPPQVFVAELGRELAVAPERLGGTARLDLPLRAGEAGAIVLSTSAPNALPVPGFAGLLFLGGTLLPLASGVGNGSNPLAVSFPIPNDPRLEGFPLYLQGVRVDPNLNRSELTRLVILSVPMPR